jgi:RHS repeat-associated protein
MAFAGQRTRIAVRTSTGLFFILLAVLGFTTALPAYPFQSPSIPSSQSSDLRVSPRGITPQKVGADPVPSLSFPEETVSNLATTYATGVYETTSQNLTLRNPSQTLRLLGGSSPHDELVEEGVVRKGGLPSNPSSQWGVDVLVGAVWIPLLSSSTDFTIFGTNSTGTFVQRTTVVGVASYSGILKVNYAACPDGRLKWTVEFFANVSAHYRLGLRVSNFASVSMLSDRSARLKRSPSNFTVSWSDVPRSFNVTSGTQTDQLLLNIDLGNMLSGSQVQIDPYIVGTDNDSLPPTPYPYQHRVYRDPKTGYYWVFYHDLSAPTGFAYKYSTDGINWNPNPAYSMPPGMYWLGQPYQVPGMFFSGETVAVVDGQHVNCIDFYPGSLCPTEPSIVIGTIAGTQINWGNVTSIYNPQGPENLLTCQAPSGSRCWMDVGVRYESVSIDSYRRIWISANYWEYATPHNNQYGVTCPDYHTGINQGFYSSGYLDVMMIDNSGIVHQEFMAGGSQDAGGCYRYDQENWRSVMLSTDNQGTAGTTVVFQGYHHNIQLTPPYLMLSVDRQLIAQWSDGTSFTPYQILEPEVADTDGFSAVSDLEDGTHFGAHVVYTGTNGNITYAHRSAYDTNWSYEKNIFNSVQVSSPTITADYSTNDVYAFAISNSIIVMKMKTYSGHFADRTNLYPVTQRNNPTFLESSFATNSASNSTNLTLIWSEPTSSSSYNIMFASIPIQTFWSPYGASHDPWDAKGLAPYGQYFQNLGEYVSPSTGMFTVKQTDLSLSGRGLSLEITRVYTEPFSFLNGNPYNYETYPWVPMGAGWQLGFPWMNNTAQPLYIHLSDGAGYRIPYSFWQGSTATFENHQGESFRLVKYLNGTIVLLDKSGTSYRFGTPPNYPNHALASITDSTGNNTITFTYNAQNRIYCIVDTAGRDFRFQYLAGALRSIVEVNGGCDNSGPAVRSIVYILTYMGTLLSLTSVIDPAGRTTRYAYNATSISTIAPWLLARIAYPTGGYSNYTYAAALMGTQAYSYRVTRQYVGSFSTPRIREFDFAYQNSGGDPITASSVTTYNGTSSIPASITNYSYSFKGVNWNVTDSNNKFVRGVEQLFDTRGDVSQEINLVANGTTIMSYKNYYSYDLWGNQIYSRRAINAGTSPQSQESFNAYYNDELAPSFNSFQDTFSDMGLTQPDNKWNNTGIWAVQNGVYNGTYDTNQGYNTRAWSDIGKGSVSIQAQVKPTGGAGYVGLFVHYAGTDSNLWLLQFRRDGGPWRLFFQDINQTGGHLLASTPCTLTMGVWYTLNFTINDALQASGWARAPGIFCPVQANFPSSDPTTSGTGFGLYAGASKALFDNVTVTTVDPFITRTGFSNSFYQNGAPGTNIHHTVAGSAQLQNGAGSQSEETYYGYTAWGGLSQAKQLYNPLSGPQWLTSSRSYDVYGNQLTVTDTSGNSTSYGYSSSYHSAYLTTASRTLKPGSTQVTASYGYNFTMGTRTSSVDPNGYNTTYQYDILGGPTRVSYPNSLGFTQYTYNDRANYVNITNENGWLTQQIYDALGRLAMTKRFLNGTPYSNETYNYNWQDKIVNQRDAMGNRYRYQYDTLGRTTSVIEPNGNSTQTTYNDLASWILTTGENGISRCNVYDWLGRLLSVVENATSICRPGIVTNYYYDQVGNLLRLTTSTNQSTFCAYDNLNRLLKTSYPDGTSETYTYDNNGNLLSKVDRKSVTSQYYYDSLNRMVIQSLSYPGATTANGYISYDRNSNLVQLQSNNATILYNHDSRNRITSETYQVNSGFTLTINPTLANFFCTPTNPCPNSMTATLNVTSFRNFSGNVTLSYAGPGSGTGGTQLTGPPSVTLPPGGSVQATLTASHGTTSGTYLWTITGQSGGLTVSTTFAISQYICTRNCPTAPVHPAAAPRNSPNTFSSSSPSLAAASYTIQYTFSGETLANIIYPDGFLVQYSYDSLGRTIRASSGTTQYASLSYNLNDQVTNMTYGNGVKTIYTYDQLARPLNITVYGNRQLLSLAYSYYKTGTVASVVGQVNGTVVNEQYRYDSLQRLSNATITNGALNTNQWYQYDNLGNRVSQRISALQTNYYTYQTSNNELLQTTSYSNLNHQSQTTGSYAYDKNGNLLAANVTNGVTTHWAYSWSVKGDLLRVSNDNGIQGFYTYDGLDRRIESVEASTIFYAYLGTETSSEIVSGGATTDYVSVGGLRITKVTGTIVSYYHSDPLGSTRLTTSSAASVIFSDNYQPYGSDNTSKGSETYKFTGKPVSQTTGLYYEYQRWYDPSIGRFISQDPVAGHLSDPQSLNAYIYVENSPVTNTDPTGECPWCIAALLGAAIGAAVGYGWCVASTGGWTSSECGKQALEGAIVGGVIGLTLGLAAVDEGPLKQGTDELVNTADFWSNTESTTTVTTTRAPVITTPASEGATPGLETAEGGQRYAAQSLGRPGLVQYGPGPSEPGWSSAYATTGDYSTPAEVRAGLSLHGGNPATWVRDVAAPKGYPMQVSQVRALWGQPGGGIQYEVADPSVWIVGPWRPLINIPIAIIELV